MKYAPIGHNPDGTVTVRMFMDDGSTYDELFTFYVPTLEEVINDIVSTRMRAIAEKAPTKEELESPSVQVWEVPEAEAPEFAAEVS